MRLSRILFIVFLVIPMGLLIVLLGAFVWIASDRPTFDTQHPDYARYATVFSRIDEELAQSGVSKTPIDFASLNGGAWKTACLLGGYDKPIEAMHQQGAIVSDADVARMEKARHSGFRLYAVEETEAMIAYIDHDHRAHLIHFERGLGQFAENYRGCVSKPETTLIIATPR